MRPSLVCGSLILVILISLASPGYARELTITRVDPSEIKEQPGTLAVSGTCQVGNVNPAYWAIGGFLTPPESYAVSFRPSDSSCAACPLGYQVSAVHMLLQSAGAMTIVMSVGLQSATFPTDPGCAEPGPQECASGQYQVNLPGAGLWNIGLQLNCGCASKDFAYLLTVDFQSVSGGTPSLVTDNLPGACTSWNNYGSGWVDLVASVGFPGNLRIWAEASCCESPIGTDKESIGSLKGRFED